MALVDADSTWRVLVAGLAVLGVGVGHGQPDAGLGRAGGRAPGAQRDGVGAVNTARQLGFALGVAALGTVFTTAATSSLRTRGAPHPCRPGRRRSRPGRRRRSLAARADRRLARRSCPTSRSRPTPTGCARCSSPAGSAGLVGRRAGAAGWCGPRAPTPDVRGRAAERTRRPNRARALSAGRRQTAAHADEARCPTTGSAPSSSRPTPTTSSTASRPPSPPGPPPARRCTTCSRRAARPAWPASRRRRPARCARRRSAGRPPSSA